MSYIYMFTKIRSFWFKLLSTNRTIKPILDSMHTAHSTMWVCFHMDTKTTPSVIWFMVVIFQKFIEQCNLKKKVEAQRLPDSIYAQLSMDIKRTNQPNSNYTRMLFTIQFYSHKRFTWPRTIFFFFFVFVMFFASFTIFIWFAVKLHLCFVHSFDTLAFTNRIMLDMKSKKLTAKNVISNNKIFTAFVIRPEKCTIEMQTIK